MMYEARGVNDSMNYSSLPDRINSGRLSQFRQFLANGRQPYTFAELISSDDMFFRNPNVAYAESWAFSFFLMETQPRKYGEYLKKTGRSNQADSNTRARRLADFTGIFGKDIRMMEADFLRFIENLPKS